MDCGLDTDCACTRLSHARLTLQSSMRERGTIGSQCWGEGHDPCNGVVLYALDVEPVLLCRTVSGGAANKHGVCVIPRPPKRLFTDPRETCVQFRGGSRFLR
jgi:hypothetical protein